MAVSVLSYHSFNRTYNHFLETWLSGFHKALSSLGKTRVLHTVICCARARAAGV